MVSEPMVKTGSDECSMVLVSKVFLKRVSGKACPVKKNGGTEKGRKWVLVVGNASAGGGVYQCGWRDSP